MAKTATKTAPKTASRNRQLRENLEGRKRSLQADLQRRARGARSDRDTNAGDEADRSDANITESIDFALLQMKTETMRRIESAIARLDAGDYGSCASCEREMSETRLKALPFALRCTTCEEQREQGEARSRRAAGPSVFAELIGS